MTRAILTPALLPLVLAASAWARPPSRTPCEPIDDLAARLADKYESLKEQEEFAAKPRPEQLVLMLARGAENYEGRKLTGARVVEELFRWKALLAEKVEPEAARVVALLPKAIEARYGPGKNRTRERRKERRKVARMLVDALLHKVPAIRKASIECLDLLFGTRRGYDPAASEKERRRVQYAWRLALRRQAH